ncbi:hypothetical protein D3C79_474820 [compost metagenome]
MGNEELLHCELAGLRFVLRIASQPDWEPSIGEQIHLTFDLARAHLFDQASGDNLNNNSTQSLG